VSIRYLKITNVVSQVRY